MKRITAIMLGIFAVVLLTVYAYIGEPARIRGGSEPEVTEPVTTETEPVETTPAPPTNEIPEYLIGEYGSDGADYINLTEDRRGTWTKDGRESEVFWMYDSRTEEVSVFDFEGNSFVGSYDDGVLSGLYNYSDTLVLYKGKTPLTPPVVLPDPPSNPTVFETIDTFFHGGFGLTVYGAEFVRDADGDEAVRVWFDFSNYSKVTVVPSDLIDLRLYSGDVNLLERAPSSDVPGCDSFEREVVDGRTIRVAADFKTSWTSTVPLYLQIRHVEYNAAEAAGTVASLTDGKYIIAAEFDPASLPALPAGGVLPPVIQY